MLYEDELHDNGIASCTVKIVSYKLQLNFFFKFLILYFQQRVMPTSFFILLRYFLRVDNVMVRVNDTRYFHDFQTDYVLREFTNKECGIKEIKLPYTVFGDPNILSPHMPLRTAFFHKITWPVQEITKDDVSQSVSVDTAISNVNSEGDV